MIVLSFTSNSNRIDYFNHVMLNNTFESKLLVNIFGLEVQGFFRLVIIT